MIWLILSPIALVVLLLLGVLRGAALSEERLMVRFRRQAEAELRAAIEAEFGEVYAGKVVQRLRDGGAL